MVMSQIAEVLINATNQSMDSWDQSPAGSLMEVQLIDWLRQKVGYGSGQAGVFTSGGTQSNLMGVLLARDWCIAKNWKDENGNPWSVQRDGIPAEAMKTSKSFVLKMRISLCKEHGNDGHGLPVSCDCSCE